MCAGVLLNQFASMILDPHFPDPQDMHPNVLQTFAHKKWSTFVKTSVCASKCSKLTGFPSSLPFQEPEYPPVMEWSPPIEIGLELALSIVLKKLVICAIQCSLSFALGKAYLHQQFCNIRVYSKI